MHAQARRTVRLSSRTGRTLRTAAIAAVATVAVAACSSGGSDETTAVGTTAAATAPQTVAPTTVAPTAEAGTFVGSEGDVPWTVIMPADWKNGGWWNSGWGVVKGDPLFGFVTAEVGNIYADPCQWQPVPPFGPAVDDLVAAWANVPGFDASATKDVTVDGYAGKQIEFTVPNHNADECSDGRYGIWQEPIAHGDSPSYWAQGPDAHHQVWIVEVDGARLVIAAWYLPDTSPQDRAALDGMLASIQIG